MTMPDPRQKEIYIYLGCGQLYLAYMLEENVACYEALIGNEMPNFVDQHKQMWNYLFLGQADMQTAKAVIWPNRCWLMLLADFVGYKSGDYPDWILSNFCELNFFPVYD